MTDWDAIAAELGLPADWREIGYDEPETMVRMYPERPGMAMSCPWPNCGFRRHRGGLEAMFRHVHGGHRRGGPRR